MPSRAAPTEHRLAIDPCNPGAYSREEQRRKVLARQTRAAHLVWDVMSKITELEPTILKALATIEHPQFKQNLQELGMFSRLEEDGETLRLFLKTPDNDRKIQIDLESKIRSALRPAELPGKLKIKFEVDESLKPEDIGNRVRGVKNIIAVGSGKGGVGKSTVSANLALSLAKQGHSVGLIDADIYGPSLGKMFGVPGKLPLTGDGENRVRPHEVAGIKLVSFAFLLNPDQAVVWRGPMLGKAIEQFLFQVIWGELDYLIIDLPPGTGDVQLSLGQMVDLDGAVIVTTPQNVAIQDASRAVHMFTEIKVPVLGVIENMSEFICPSCGHVAHIFSKNGAQAFAAKFKVPQLGSIPLQQSIMEAGEEGQPIVAREPDGPIAKAYEQVIEKMAVEVEKYR